MKNQKKQAVVKIKGTLFMIENILDILEQHTNCFTSNIMDSDRDDDKFVFVTVLGVDEN